MIIREESDLHIEFTPKYTPNLEGVDTYVLSGDVAQGLTAYKYCSELLNKYPNLHIIHTSGNHEYYDQRMEKLDSNLSELSKENERYHYLQNSSVVLNGYKFIGATLWTDFDKRDPLKVSRAWNGMNDFSYIKYVIGHHKHKFTPYRAAKLCDDSRKYIFQELEESKEPCIVVTHHKPFISENNPLSSAYEVDLDKELNACTHLPLIWFFGHTHKSEDKEIEYEHGKVRFISNCFGYPKEETGFNYDKVYRLGK